MKISWVTIFILFCGVLWLHTKLSQIPGTEAFNSYHPILNEDQEYPSIIDSNVYYKYDVGRFIKDRPCLKHHLPHNPIVGHIDPITAMEPILFREDKLRCAPQ